MVGVRRPLQEPRVFSLPFPGLQSRHTATRSNESVSPSEGESRETPLESGLVPSDAEGTPNADQRNDEPTYDDPPGTGGQHDRDEQYRMYIERVVATVQRRLLERSSPTVNNDEQPDPRQSTHEMTMDWVEEQFRQANDEVMREWLAEGRQGNHPPFEFEIRTGPTRAERESQMEDEDGEYDDDDEEEDEEDDSEEGEERTDNNKALPVETDPLIPEATENIHNEKGQFIRTFKDQLLLYTHAANLVLSDPLQPWPEDSTRTTRRLKPPCSLPHHENDHFPFFEVPSCSHNH